MSRYERDYDGERRTVALHVQLTPGERALLEDAAREAGAASLSAYARAVWLRRLGDTELVASTRRNLEARRLAYELSAIGNNLNQIARVANTTGAITAADDLRTTIASLKAAFARVLSL